MSIFSRIGDFLSDLFGGGEERPEPEPGPDFEERFEPRPEPDRDITLPEGIEPYAERIEATPGETVPQYDDAEPAEIPQEERAFLIGDIMVVRDHDLIDEEAMSTRATEFSEWSDVLNYLNTPSGQGGIANAIFRVEIILYGEDEEFFTVWALEESDVYAGT